MRTLTVGLLIFAAAGCKSGGAGPAPAAQAKPAVSVESAAVPAAAQGVGLRVARSSRLGPYLTDLNGRALYLLESEKPSGGGCHDTCVAIWPPLFAGQAAPVAGDSAVDPRSIATITRRDGLRQVSFNGHPLYYYVGDGKPGQTLGQHVEDSWGEWYLVSPRGGHVEDRRQRPREDDRRNGRSE